MTRLHGRKHSPVTMSRWALGLVVVVLYSAMCASAASGGGTLTAYLYFADAGSPFLVAESRVIGGAEGPLAGGRQLVEALIDGSQRGHLATIPEGTQLRSFFILDDGTAVVDFSGPFRENHPGSCRREQLTLFCVVNTLVLNISSIRQVRILVDGIGHQTLAGHVALDFPLTADMLLTR